jgi:hypothetical protein
MQLVANRDNNFGDAMCQMRGLKEYQDSNHQALDFITCHYLHYVAAKHTDLFNNIYFGDIDYVNSFVSGYQSKGYEKLIEFRVDWGKAVSDGILRAWVEETLKFTPSTDKPYWIVSEEEKITAQCQYITLLNHPHLNTQFRKSMILNLESVSDYNRGFRQEDWQRIVDMIPQDVAIFYPVPITWTFGNPLQSRRNLFVLPGYPMGVTAALHQLVDCVFVVHSGPIMIAHAVGAKRIIQINFNNGGGSNLLVIPPDKGENITYNSNSEVNWDGLQEVINRNL